MIEYLKIILKKLYKIVMVVSINQNSKFKSIARKSISLSVSLFKKEKENKCKT